MRKYLIFKSINFLSYFPIYLLIMLGQHIFFLLLKLTVDSLEMSMDGYCL